MNNTNNEEQAGCASEVWRLRQFFGRSDERIGLRLLPTSCSAYIEREYLDAGSLDRPTVFLCLFRVCQLDLLFLKCHSIEFFHYRRDIRQQSEFDLPLEHFET